MTNPTFWNKYFVWPILNLLIVYYTFFEYLHFPGPLGFAIIGLTITIRVALWPFMEAQMRSTKKMQKLKPYLDELNKKHKDDKAALQKAQQDLYKEHGVNPLAGCLPTLVQMPILLALYSVFNMILVDTSTSGNQALIDSINEVLYFPGLHLDSFDPTFLGVNLAIKPSQWQQYGVWLLAIPVITGALQWLQTNMMMKQQNQKTIQKTSSNENKLAKKEESSPEDMTAAVSKQMAFITPILFGFFAYQFPIGLALYWNVFSLFGIIQQRIINKRYG